MPPDAFQGVIFDMDGTLVEPLIDFAALRVELGVSPSTGLIEAISQMPAESRLRAQTLLLQREDAAARRADLLPGAADIIARVRAAGLKLALLTRNARQCVNVVLGRFADMRFDLVRCRDDGRIKPQPDGVLEICRTLGIEPARTACVGDFRYDIEAANAAGAVSVLFAPGDRPSFADEADIVITDLSQLREVLCLP